MNELQQTRNILNTYSIQRLQIYLFQVPHGIYLDIHVKSKIEKDFKYHMSNQDGKHIMRETEEAEIATSSHTSISTTTTADIGNDSQMENNNRQISSPPVSSSASVALSYLKQPMVVREAAVAAAAAEASNNNPNTPPLDLTKEEDFSKIDQSVGY